jgi:TPR repeat protein
MYFNTIVVCYDYPAKVRGRIMGRVEKTVFISYRRTDESWGLAIFQDLTQHGYDVFIDYDGIASGDFETLILENIRARAHFLALLTPTALARCGDPADWMRREIEAALDSQRNIVPLMLEGFDFGTPATASQLTGKLATLKKYNALEIPKARYFSSEMERLRNKFLNVQVDAVLHPASDSAQQAAKEQKDKAAMALEDVLRREPLSAPLSPQGSRSATQVLWRKLEHVPRWRLFAGSAFLLRIAIAAVWRSGPSITVAPSVTSQDASALYSKGELYYYLEDYAKAREFYEKAAGGGNADAMFRLGTLWDSTLIFHSGLRGVSNLNDQQLYAKAREWYEKAADLNNDAAMEKLGALYEHGRGVAQDYVKARKWYEVAAAVSGGNDADAMSNLGGLYQHGLGVEQDYAKARELYEKAAAKGNADAMSNLGGLYQHGLGVEQDYAKARELYEKAYLQVMVFPPPRPRDAIAVAANAANNLGWLCQNVVGAWRRTTPTRVNGTRKPPPWASRRP